MYRLHLLYKSPFQPWHSSFSEQCLRYVSQWWLRRHPPCPLTYSSVGDRHVGPSLPVEQCHNRDGSSDRRSLSSSQDSPETTHITVPAVNLHSTHKPCSTTSFFLSGSSRVWTEGPAGGEGTGPSNLVGEVQWDKMLVFRRLLLVKHVADA